MTDDAIPPSHKGPFRSSASFSNMSTRLEPFTLSQIARLHEFHAQMHMIRNVCCTLGFDYGHNHARATYRLTSPMAAGREITVALIELRKGNENFIYSVRCEIDEALHSEETVLKASRVHQDIPEHALQLMQKKMTELSKQVYFETPPLSATAVYDGLMDRIGPKNG